MVRQEIEYQETVTEELTVCDNCGNEADEDGTSLTSHANPRIDLCSECVRNLSGEEQPSEYVTLVEEWKQMTDNAGDSIEKNLTVFTGAQILVTILLTVAAFHGLVILGFVAIVPAIFAVVYGLPLFNPDIYPWR